MGCNPTVDYGNYRPQKMDSAKSLFCRVAGVYFKVAVVSPSTHSAKEIRLYQIDCLVAATAEKRHSYDRGIIGQLDRIRVIITAGDVRHIVFCIKCVFV